MVDIYGKVLGKYIICASYGIAHGWNTAFWAAYKLQKVRVGYSSSLKDHPKLGKKISTPRHWSRNSRVQLMPGNLAENEKHMSIMSFKKKQLV